MRKTSLLFAFLVAAGCGGEVATSDGEAGGAFSHGGHGGGGGGGAGGGGGIHWPPPAPPPIPWESLDGESDSVGGLPGIRSTAAVDSYGWVHVVTHDLAGNAWLAENAVGLVSFSYSPLNAQTPSLSPIATNGVTRLVAICGAGTADAVWSTPKRDLTSLRPAGFTGPCVGPADLRPIDEADGRIALFRVQWQQLYVDQANAGQLFSDTNSQNLGGIVDPMRWALTSDIAGKIVVASGRDDATYTLHQTVTNGRYWSPWSPIPGSKGFVRVAAGRAADGRVTVFGITSSGDLYAAREKQAGYEDFDWALFVDSTAIAVDDLQVGTNRDGRLEVFARGSDATLYHVVETPTPGTFGAFTKMIANVANDSVVRLADGRVVVFWSDTSQTKPVQYRAQANPGLWHSTPPGPIN